jgi:predicted phosphodiesterase
VRRAIISDIHGNLEALQAVLADIRDQNCDQTYCLGDIIGYGPNPLECLDLSRHFDMAILGNHDQGALFDPEGFSSGAERAIFWTRDQLEREDGDSDKHRERLTYLAELQRNIREPSFLFVHGSARNPLNEYVFPEDIYNQQKIEKIFTLIERYCFQGHTHVPGVFTDAGKFYHPDEVGCRYTLSAAKAMINVGSVGQPRDGDPRSSYVILAGDVVEFRRVEYPIEQTVNKIYAIPELDDFLGDRLREGR